MTKGFRLEFTAPYHIGGWRDDLVKSQLFPQSDMLFGGVIANLALRHETFDELLSSKDKFGLSSAMPALKFNNEVWRYFLPKPFISEFFKLDPSQSNLSTYRKAIKKVQFIDEQDFQKFNQGKDISFDPEYVLPGGLFSSSVSNKSYSNSFFTIETQERVSLENFEFQEPNIENLNQISIGPRSQSSKEETNTSSPLPFAMERIQLGESSALFVIASGTESQLATFEKGLKLLGLSGIGSDRSVGNGFFNVYSFVFNFPKSSELGTNFLGLHLGLFLPESYDEFKNLFIKSSNCGYDIIRRGGYLSHAPYLGLKKKSIHMVVAGSVSNSKAQVLGTIVDLRHGTIKTPVYRFGQTLIYPLKSKS